ncbi:response regulator transcription factor [bacterium]|nr:response regulator transcription factor [bacterium]
MPQILLVEDTVELANVIVEELKRSGFDVQHVGDGESALDMLQNSEVDLVILDWMLPGMDGLTVLRRLRQTDYVPVLMLTARSDELDRIMGLELGADDYLTKPFSLREMTARVRAILRRHDLIKQQIAEDQSVGEDELHYGEICLMASTREFLVSGRMVDLTKIEFDMMALLMRHPGRVFSRSYLLDSIWGNDVVVTDRSVDNTVLKLRKKLEDHGDAIETVWGVGYRLKRRSA